MAPRLCGLLLLAVCVLAVAGCGGGGSSATAVSAEPISFRQLASSASTSAQASSGRFSFAASFTMPGADEPFEFSGEGAFNESSKRSSFAMDMSSVAKLLGGLVAGFGGTGAADMPDFDDPDGWKIEVVKDGDVDYVRFPAMDDKLPAGKTWIRGSGGTVEATGVGLKELDSFTNSDPRDVLGALRSVSGTVETVGTVELHGVETTHYRATVDAADLARNSASKTGAVDGILDGITSNTEAKDVPLDVWIDGDGLVRKVSLDVAAPQAGSSDDGEASLAFEMWDYGKDVVIDLPPASQVVDASAVHD
jgi:hypothetical protein